jgi:hypothetical protein
MGRFQRNRFAAWNRITPQHLVRREDSRALDVLIDLLVHPSIEVEIQLLRVRQSGWQPS